MVIKALENSPFKPGEYHHVGVVVRDIKKTIEYLTALGIGPFGMPDGSLYIEESFRGMLHGRPATWKLRISNARVGESELELLEPCGGESALQEFLDSRGEGLHHIGYLVDDVPAEMAKMAEYRIEVLTSGEGEKASFAYFDTSAIGGIIIEVRSR
jgi:methylmalonyl-CoA/ethylmalonyl-CoA epimerase